MQSAPGPKEASDLSGHFSWSGARRAHSVYAYSLPEVLTDNVNGSKQSLTVAPLSEIGGVVNPSEMWAFSYGGQSAAAVKSGAIKHT